MDAELEPLPTRKDEDYRYSDLGALARVWPVPREEILVPSGQRTHLTIVEDQPGEIARHLVIEIEAGAEFDLRMLNTGAAFGRIAVDVQLGAGARFKLGAAQLGNAGQTLEIVTDIAHEAPDAVSRQIIRSVLADQATGTYLGKYRGCARRGWHRRGTIGAGDAARSAPRLPMPRPELEIFADDVKCAHGCAVGELDAAGLFYLASRGLPPAEAKRLMLQAFVAEAFAGAPEEERLQALALARLETLV